MRILLDTHIFLWLIEDNKRLSDRYRREIYNLDNEIFLSVVSIWECVVKYQIGKLDFSSSPETYLPLERRKHLIKTLAVEENSIAQLINILFLVQYYSPTYTIGKRLINCLSTITTSQQ